MNDFTKDELESLVAWGEVYTEFGSAWCDKVNRPLIDKLQSLIDNYPSTNACSESIRKYHELED